MKLVLNNEVLCRSDSTYAQAYRSLFKSLSVYFKEEPDEKTYINFRLIPQKINLPEGHMADFLEYLDMGVGTTRLKFVGDMVFELEVTDEGWD